MRARAVTSLSGGFTNLRVTKSFEWERTTGGLWSHRRSLVPPLTRSRSLPTADRLLGTEVHQDYIEWLLPLLPLASSNVLSAFSQSSESQEEEACIPLSCSPSDQTTPRYPGGSSGRRVPPHSVAGLLQ